MAGEAAHFGDQRRLVLVVGYVDLVLVADFGNHQPEPDAALGDLLVLLARLGLGRALILEAAAVLFDLVLDPLPDLLELRLDQLLRHVEAMARVERVEHLALDVLAAHRIERRAHLRLDRLAQRREVVEPEGLGEIVVQLAILGARRRGGW